MLLVLGLLACGLPETGDTEAGAGREDTGTGSICDGDGDGYCGQDGDCNDGDADVHPYAPETCDGLDNDCDGSLDEADALGAPIWYADRDGDTYGDSATTRNACAQPDGYVANSSDCDDMAATTFPGAPEECDGLDNDCDGTLDNGLSVTPFYADADADGYGADGSAVDACAAPPGYLATAGDCDDLDATINPQGVEVCDDGVDNDCNGWVDADIRPDPDDPDPPHVGDVWTVFLWCDDTLITGTSRFALNPPDAGVVNDNEITWAVAGDVELVMRTDVYEATETITVLD